MERSSGTQVIHRDLAAMGNLSGCILQTFTYVWGEGMGHGTYRNKNKQLGHSRKL